MSAPVCLLSAHGWAWWGSWRRKQAVKTQHDQPCVNEKCEALGPKGGLIKFRKRCEAGT